MSGFIIGFTFTTLFIVGVGIAALVFISFDDDSSDNPTTKRLYEIVRRINTETIETVDVAGKTQQWTRSV